jgi:hypothetical protein
MERWSLRDWRAHLALWLPAAIWFAPELLFGRVGYFRDTGLYFQPHKALIANALRAGRLAEWNPFEYAGMPLLADPNFNAFHPLSLLTDLLPLPWGFAVFLFVCALLAAYGARALARTLGLSQAGALACGLFFAWSGPTVSFLLTGQAVASCTLPWLCAAGAKLGRERSLRAALLLALVAGLQFLAGTPEVGACGFVLAGLLTISEALVHTAESGGNLRARATADLLLRAVGLYALAALLGAGLAAIQLGPSARFLHDSSRGNGIDPSEALLFSMHPWRVPGLILPFFTGDIDGPGAPSWILPLSENPYVQELYLGLGAVALALLGMRSVGARRRWPLLAMTLVFGAVALGGHLPLASLLWRTLPPLRIVRFPEKMIVPLSLSVAVFAGAGWEILKRWFEHVTAAPSPQLARRCFAGALSAAGLALLSSQPRLWLPRESKMWPEERILALDAGPLASLGLVLVLLAAFLLLVALCARGQLRASVALTASVALVVAELASPGLRLDRTGSREDWSEPPALVAILAQDAQLPPSQFRISSQSNGLSTAQLDAVAREDDSPRSLALFRLRRIALFDAGFALHGFRSDRGYSGFTPGELRRFYRGSHDGAVLDLLGVRYAIDFGSGASPYLAFGFTPRPDLQAALVAQRPSLAASLVHIYENRRAGPVAWLSPVVLSAHEDGTPRCEGRFVPFLDDADLRALDPGVARAESCAGLAGKLADPSSTDPTVPSFRAYGKAALTSVAPELLAVAVEAPAPSLLVISETSLPGWRAFVDGTETPVLNADGALRACAVPAGSHRVELRYQAPGLRTGAWISAFSLIVFAGLSLLAVSYRRASKA